MHVSKTAVAIVATMFVTAGGAAAQQTVNLATNSNREVWRGETSGSQAGFSLDRGDVHAGDNRRDLIVGAPGWGSQTGRVYVIISGADHPSQVSLASADVILTGAAAGDRFGEATAAGYITAQELTNPMPTRDLVVGAPGKNSNSGAVYVFMRGVTHGQQLSTSNALLTITGAPAGARLGASLATGDLDGDGYREIIAGAPGAGAVYVIKGGPSISGTVNLSTPSAAFFKIQGSAADGVGKSLAAGDLTGHGALARTNITYDLAIGAYNEAGGGAVYVIKGRSTNSFPGTMNLTTEADVRFGGIDAGDRAGWVLDMAPFDNDMFFDLIVGAPNGDGPANTRAQAGEVYVMWGSATLSFRSFANADLTIYGAAAGHLEGSDVSYGAASRGQFDDIVSLAPGASGAGELHVLLTRMRSRFPAVYDLAATLPDRTYVGDPAAGPIASTLIYGANSGNFEDIVAAVPGATEGMVYISYSPTYADNSEPNDTIGSAGTIPTGLAVSSYVFTANDVDWFKFSTREPAHIRLTLDVPGGVNYDVQLFTNSGTLLKTSERSGAGEDEEIVTTLAPGTYAIKVVGSGAFSQSTAYIVQAAAGFFNDAFEPNGDRASAATIGTLPYSTKVFSSEDLDWYRFRNSRSNVVNIQLTVPATADFNLALFSSGGTQMAASENGIGVNESIVQTLGTGEYLIRVSSGGGSSSTVQNYTLALSGAGVANPTLPNILLGQGPYPGAGGYVAVRGGAESSFASNMWSRLPWPGYNAGGGGVRVATGDVDGDGLDEVVLGLDQTGSGWLAVLDDAAHGYALLAWLRVPWPAYIAANGGETFPAVGDVDGDGRAEIVVGLGSGSEGWYEILDDATQGYQHLGWRQVSWAGYNTRNGVTHPAVGDLDGDGAAEILIGLGSGSVGWLEVVNNGLLNFSHRGWIQVQWPTYNAANGTTFPAIGDLDGDGKGEMVVGLGSGSQGWFQVFDDAQTGFAHLRWEQLSWPSYNSYSGELHPAVGNIDGDPEAEIVFGLAEYFGSGSGGWFEMKDDANAGYVSLGWRNVIWEGFTAYGGALVPAIAARR